MKKKKLELKLSCYEKTAPTPTSIGQTDSPWGTVMMSFDADKRLFRLDFPQHASEGEQEPTPIEQAARTQQADDLAKEIIEAYLDPTRQGKPIPISLYGTPFRLKVWQAIAEIGRGETISYSDLCKQVTGDTRAVRAVASSVGKNPVALLLPCHRVVSKDGELGGFYWGLAMKESLLRFEHVSLPSLSRAAAKPQIQNKE